ncbi:hypothetical protein BT67DRAFT_445118 [Trichocladium antarcticum]|uniref:Uncharacterized protein n=1 Tax=Trichocladium antarcticum TaxID=1450529 RepID=A0AAN6UDE8_9PEZI|nr:hypothetical protein BT67DRAFT_445118 [Trichocladium antarcticum]
MDNWEGTLLRIVCLTLMCIPSSMCSRVMWKRAESTDYLLPTRPSSYHEWDTWTGI